MERWPNLGPLILAIVLSCAVAGIARYVSSTGPDNYQNQYAADESSDNQPKDNGSGSIAMWDWLCQFLGWITRDAVSFFTFALFCATAVLSFVAVVQIVYLGRADKTAGIAANAAKKSADAAIGAERAWIYVVVEQTNFQTALAVIYDNSPDMIATAPEITFRFKNYGKTPAIIKELSMSSIICAERPPIPVYSVIAEPFRQKVIGTNEVTDQRTETTAQFTVKDALEVSKGPKWLWFTGQLAYDDVFGNPHTHRFYWRSNGNIALQPYDHDYYNKST